MSRTAKGPSFAVKALTLCFALVVLCGLLATALFGWGIKYYNAPGPLAAETAVIIPKGSGLAQISAALAESEVILYPQAFRIATLIQGKGQSIKAGEYAFTAGVTPENVLESLVSGRTVVHKITIPEGLTTAQIRTILMNEEKLEGTVPADVKEGELLPETYYFSRGDTRGEIMARMKQGMREQLMTLWSTRRQNLPYRTPQEALVMASIVEKETGVAEEYGQVASVYVNRLRRNMLLQADPTVIYAVTKGEQNIGRPLTRSDLRLESAYNTYVFLGLPPGPIANPGKRALAATLNPPETDYIFFVANGKGGHNFSTSLDDHNRYVRQFRALLKKQREEKQVADAETATSS